MSEFTNGFLWGVGIMVAILVILYLRGAFKMGVTP